MQRKLRVLVAKPGLDGHDRGAKVVAAALRDAGMEVIYTGLHQSPAQIVEAAVQEDVDVVALSILSGAHMTLFPEVLELMKQRGDVSLGDDSAAEDEDVRRFAGLEQIDPAREKRGVGAGEDGQADDVGVLLDRGLDDLLGRLVQAGVDDLHAGIAQRPRDDLGAAIVPIEARFCHDDSIAALHGGAY